MHVQERRGYPARCGWSVRNGSRPGGVQAVLPTAANAPSWEVGDDLGQWFPAEGYIELIRSELSASGFYTQTLWETGSMNAPAARYFRLRISGP